MKWRKTLRDLWHFTTLGIKKYKTKGNGVMKLLWQSGLYWPWNTWLIWKTLPCNPIYVTSYIYGVVPRKPYVNPCNPIYVTGYIPFLSLLTLSHSSHFMTYRICPFFAFFPLISFFLSKNIRTFASVCTTSFTWLCCFFACRYHWVRRQKQMGSALKALLLKTELSIWMTLLSCQWCA